MTLKIHSKLSQVKPCICQAVQNFVPTAYLFVLDSSMGLLQQASSKEHDGDVHSRVNLNPPATCFHRTHLTSDWHPDTGQHNFSIIFCIDVVDTSPISIVGFDAVDVRVTCSDVWIVLVLFDLEMHL